jgi:hypothetical protein
VKGNEVEIISVGWDEVAFEPTSPSFFFTSSILQSKTRDLLIHTVWATLREQMSHAPE